jgi:hypothetical protein
VHRSDAGLDVYLNWYPLKTFNCVVHYYKINKYIYLQHYVCCNSHNHIKPKKGKKYSYSYTCVMLKLRSLLREKETFYCVVCDNLS